LTCRLDQVDQDPPSGPRFASQAEDGRSATANREKEKLDAEYAERYFTEQPLRGCIVFQGAADPPLDRTGEASAAHA